MNTRFIQINNTASNSIGEPNNFKVRLNRPIDNRGDSKIITKIKNISFLWTSTIINETNNIIYYAIDPNIDISNYSEIYITETFSTPDSRTNNPYIGAYIIKPGEYTQEELVEELNNSFCAMFTDSTLTCSYLGLNKFKFQFTLNEGSGGGEDALTIFGNSTSTIFRNSMAPLLGFYEVNKQFVYAGDDNASIESDGIARFYNPGYVDLIIEELSPMVEVANRQIYKRIHINSPSYGDFLYIDFSESGPDSYITSYSSTNLLNIKIYYPNTTTLLNIDKNTEINMELVIEDE